MPWHDSGRQSNTGTMALLYRPCLLETWQDQPTALACHCALKCHLHAGQDMSANLTGARPGLWDRMQLELAASCNMENGSNF